MSKQLTPETEVVTLENVFKSIQHWRTHKKAYPGCAIPDEVWGKIFILAEQDEYSPSSLRQFFKLNSEQYNRKNQELMGKASPEKKPINHSNEENKASLPATPLVEAVPTPDSNIPPLKAAADNTKKAMKSLKSTKPFETSMLDSTTVVVECIRADGQRLKIHMTAQRLDVVMEAFFNQNNAS